MLTKSNKTIIGFYALLIGLALLVGIGNFLRHLEQVRTEIEASFQSRSELLSKFVALHRDQVAVMRNLLLDSFQSAGQPATSPLVFREQPQLAIWELASLPVQGSLTGRGVLPLNPGVEREIHAALAMDAQIRAALEFNNEVAWLYYLSAKEFIYLAPQAPVASFHFDSKLYQQRYWLEAGPSANPARRMILAGPQQDLAGKGWILTFAYPVYDGDTYLGITALDLRVDTLQHLASIGDAVGESMIVSENNRLIAKQSGFQPDVVVHPPLSDKLIDWRTDEAGALWLSSPVVKDELWLVHKVTQSQVYLAAARETLAAWFMILLLALLGLMAHRLRHVLAEVTRMTHTDPLTQALNRRGFHEKVVTLIAHAKRHELPIVVLMMDIDFFKKVNDTYGHAEGDSVLKQLGTYLLKASRPMDLVCRWGGEEFVFTAPLERAQDASALAERMRQEAQRTRIQPGNIPITLSGGLVLLRPDEAIDDAVKRADELLYKAKEGGRNRIEADLSM